MSRNIAVEDLARGYSLSEQNGILEVTLHKSDFFLEVGLLETEHRFAPVRVMHCEDKAWLIASPIAGVPGKWSATAYLRSPVIDPSDRTFASDGVVLPRHFTCSHDGSGLSVGIVRARYGRFVKLKMVRPDGESLDSLLIGYDVLDRSWSLQVPLRVMMLDENPSLHVPGWHEVKRLEADQVPYTQQVAAACVDAPDVRSFLRALETDVPRSFNPADLSGPYVLGGGQAF